MDADPVERSRAYLRRVRAGESTEEVVAGLARADPSRLSHALDGDDARLAFWLNVYNAAAREVLADDPTVYENRRAFFGSPRLTVAGTDLSLDDVEHGILRRSRFKWGLGYVPNPVAGSFERRFRVDERDPRVHFALNCGAESCPPIVIYERERVDEQLRRATEAYLETNATHDLDAGVVSVPRLCLWFLGDFGGRSGVRAFLREHGAIPADAAPRLRFADYDWTLSLGEFRDW